MPPTSSGHSLHWISSLTVLFALEGSATALPAQSTTEVARIATPATVTIVTLDSQGDTLGLGSGFVVTASGIIVTNYHVMRGASGAVVRFASGEEFDRVEAIDADAPHDVAVLKVPGYGLKMLMPAPNIPAVGAKLIVIGAPRGLDFTVSEGIVSALRMEDGRQWIQMTAPISPGSSGGPVLNAQGQVVGISTMYRTDGQSLNFAVPIKYAMRLVQGRSSPRRLASVFAADADGTDGGESTAFSGNLPARANNADDSWLADTYSVRGWVTSTQMGQEPETGTWSGLLLAADANAGIMIWRWDDSSTRRQPVEAVMISNMFATDGGRVLLSLSGAPHQGYFTADGGMVLAADTVVDHQKLSELILATPYQLDLTTPTGLYTLEWRSTWYPDGTAYPSLGPTGWNGQGAFAFIGDSAYVALTLRNARGGGTAFYGTGPGSAGAFDLTMSDGAELVGHITAGQLVATFLDVRDEGSLRGQLSGRRK